MASLDIAAANLLCSEGLPGSEKLDIDQCLSTLDRWAERVKAETGRNMHRLGDPAYAQHYRNSQAMYRMEMLCQVLQEDLGVRYNEDRAREVSFTDSRDLFMHGIIEGRGGTCVSMPVLYVAVGRRLGYPLRLVEAKSHLLCRWEGKGADGREERLNVEGSGSGFGSFPDEHYMTWPRPISREEVERGEYLRSLSAGEEFGRVPGRTGALPAGQWAGSGGAGGVRACPPAEPETEGLPGIPGRRGWEGVEGDEAGNGDG